MAEFAPLPNNIVPERIYLLGSASPRRKLLLAGLDIQFEVVKIDADESFPQKMAQKEVPEFLAKIKSIAYGALKADQTLITADTIVLHNGEILNKPTGAMEAKEMLNKLSGQTHQVITGVYLRNQTKQRTFSETTSVTFNTLSTAEIDYYVSSYQPFDKAGGYGIQEWLGYVGITGVVGCYYNVMGLPLSKLYRELCTF